MCVICYVIVDLVDFGWLLFVSVDEEDMLDLV